MSLTSGLLVFVSLALLAAPRAAGAQCAIGLNLGGIRDTEVIETLRCMNSEIARLKRDQARLEQRLKELERLETRFPEDYANVDGKVTEEPGRAIGRASFVLTARSTGSASVLPVEQRVLEEVCGKSGGCSLSVIFRQFSLFDGEAKETVLTGPCQFIYARSSGAWAIGEGCAVDGTSGTDGDQLAVTGESSGSVITASGGACLFAESEMARARSEDTIARDGSRGLFLLSVPSRQPDGIRRYTCELAMK
jgi:hypothetical protein